LPYAPHEDFPPQFSIIAFNRGFSSIAFQKDFPPSSVAISMIFQSTERLVGRPYDRKNIEIPPKDDRPED
jgi:hypothetical protein